jgi:hypothetical protein
LENWETLSEKKKYAIFTLLMERVDDSNGKKYTLNNAKDLLQKYVSSREKGFVSGTLDIEYLFAAVGLKCPIYVVDVKSESKSFLPDGEIKYSIGFGRSVRGSGKQIYLGEIRRHTEALIPLGNKGSQKVKNKSYVPDKKVSEVKEAIAKNIVDIIHNAIDKKNSLLIEACNPEKNFFGSFFEKSSCVDDRDLFVAMGILREVYHKLDDDEEDSAIALKKEIGNILKKKNEQKLSDNENKKLENFLKQFVNIFAEKATELCKINPLFWGNVGNLISDSLKEESKKRIKEIESFMEEIRKGEGGVGEAIKDQEKAKEIFYLTVRHIELSLFLKMV